MRLKDPLTGAAKPAQPAPQAPPQGAPAAPSAAPLALAPSAPETAPLAPQGAPAPHAPAASVSDASRALWEVVRPAALAGLSDEFQAMIVAARGGDVAHTVVMRDLSGGQVAKIDGAHPMAAELAENCALGLNTLIKGPAGSGKTHAVRQVAEAMGKPLFIVGSLTDSFQVTGFMNVTGDYVETEVSRWAESKGAYLLLDEFDGYAPNAALVLNMSLANGVLVTAKGAIHIDPSNVVIATANTWGQGANAEYVGRNKMDAATLDRFVKLEWEYDEAFERRIAAAKAGITDMAIPRTVQAIRANCRAAGFKWVISPRATIAYCKLRAAGRPIDRALRATALSMADDKQWEIATKGGVLCLKASNPFPSGSAHGCMNRSAMKTM